MYCRICLCPSENLKAVSEQTAEGKRLTGMFTDLTCFQWIDSSKWPSYLCFNCESTLEASYNFKQLCQRSHVKWLLEKNWTECDELDDQESVNKELKQFSKKEVSRAIDDYRRNYEECPRCIECDFEATGLKDLAIHMSIVHKNADWCCLCNKIFHNLEKHRTKHNGDTVKCSFCLDYIERKIFIQHLQQHSTGDRNKKKEEKPKRIFEDDSDDLDDDKIDANPQPLSTEEHDCHICEEKQNSWDELKLHLRRHYFDDRFRCSFCGKPHKFRSALIIHERTHTGEKPHTCQFCGKGFAQVSQLRTHIGQHIGRPVKCIICSKGFCRNSELNVHMRSHTGEKPFLCTICGKSYIQKCHLTEHMKSHSEEKPHVCGLCGKAFHKRSLLQVHVRTHSAHRPYQCPECDYAAHKSYTLQTHMKLHNRERQNIAPSHICVVCDKTFPAAALLRAHVKTLHNAIL